VDPGQFLALLTGSGGAVVALAWMVWMQRQDIKDMRRENTAANTRASASDEAARTTLAVLQAMADRKPGQG
jgi:hypothetical protein